MGDQERENLAKFIKERLALLDIRAAELARRAGVDRTVISLLLQKKIRHPRVDTIQSLANALEVPVGDLFAQMDWLPEESLPSLLPYMRTKYQDLSPEALAEIERFVTQHSREYRGAPRPHEDEEF